MHIHHTKICMHGPLGILILNKSVILAKHTIHLLKKKTTTQKVLCLQMQLNFYLSEKMRVRKACTNKTL